MKIIMREKALTAKSILGGRGKVNTKKFKVSEDLTFEEIILLSGQAIDEPKNYMCTVDLAGDMAWLPSTSKIKDVNKDFRPTDLALERVGFNHQSHLIEIYLD